jgi:hypothetical protein
MTSSSDEDLHAEHPAVHGGEQLRGAVDVLPVQEQAQELRQR